MNRECSTHVMGESCPACRAAGHYETQLHLARLQEENRTFRKALEFYADSANWEESGPEPGEIDGIVAVKFDKGAIARTVLFTPAAEGVRDREARREENEGRDRQVMGAGSVSHGQSGDLNIAPGHAAAATQPASPHSSTRRRIS